MMRFIRPRLRKPLLRGIAGMVLAGAWAIVIAVAALGNAAGWYVWAGADSDDGALLGSRADERQKLVGQQARALAGTIAMAAAYAGLVVMLAVKRADAWPFAATLAVTGLGYLFGLSTYGSGEPDPEDETTAGRGARSPISR